MIKLTIFTPTFNRKKTLERTYQSLLRQNSKEFIWLIIDDGSTDGTDKMVNNWQEKNNAFDIQYIYKENGGMHTAHNVAYEHINTELNMCIDSDDLLAENAVEKILDKWEQVRNKGYAGLIGLDADFNGNIIGKGFPNELEETTLCDYYAMGGKGDKKLIYRTDIIKEFPEYPVFKGERYVALGCKYRLIDQKYKLAVLNEVLCKVEYQIDGSSRTMWKQYLKNPQGFAFWRKICMKYPESKKRIFIDCIHYVSSSILSHNIHFISESPRKILTFLAVLPGIVLTLFIKYKGKGA